MERADLATLRDGQGYTQEELGEELGVTGLTVSRYERGVSTPQGKRRRRYAKVLGISMSRLNVLLNGGGAEDDTGDEIEDDDEERLLAPKWFSLYYAVEQSAAQVESYQPSLIHGLLQTEEYARTVIERERHHYDQVERLVRLRMSRQPALVRPANPLRLVLVLSEGAVRLQVGNNALMRQQIVHLLAMAERENVTIRLLPFSAGSHIADKGAFTLSTPPWEDAPNVLYQETYLSGASYVEDEQDIRKFSALFGRLKSMCLTHAESLQMIRELREELYA